MKQSSVKSLQQAKYVVKDDNLHVSKFTYGF